MRIEPPMRPETHNPRVETMSKKLKLELDGLVVESFGTQVPAERGTVAGMDSEFGPWGCSDTWNPYATCYVGCTGGCDTSLEFCTQGCDTGGNTEDPVVTCASYAIECRPTHYANDTCKPTGDYCFC